MSLKIINALKRTTGTKRRILFSVPLVNKISLASSGRLVKLSSLKWYLPPNVSTILSSYIYVLLLQQRAGKHVLVRVLSLNY